jgi:hypothetical protein
MTGISLFPPSARLKSPKIELSHPEAAEPVEFHGSGLSADTPGPISPLCGHQGIIDSTSSMKAGVSHRANIIRSNDEIPLSGRGLLHKTAADFVGAPAKVQALCKCCRYLPSSPPPIHRGEGLPPYGWGYPTLSSGLCLSGFHIPRVEKGTYQTLVPLRVPWRSFWLQPYHARFFV